jgi:hypothetical protein
LKRAPWTYSAFDQYLNISQLLEHAMKSYQSVSLKNRPNLMTLKKSGQWIPDKKVVRLVDARTTDGGVLTYGNHTKTW